MVNNAPEPLISIITITYNATKTLEATILSVINQTYSNIEYIIIDGGSTDGTVDIIKKYQSHIAYWISEPDKGIYNAMNKGIDLAHGIWINFMNAGDSFYDQNTLSNIRFPQINNKNLKVIFGDNIGKKFGTTYYRKAQPLKNIHRRIIACHQSIFVSGINKEDIKFNETYKLASDYNTVYSLYEKYGKKAFLYIPQPIAIYDAEFGISSKHILQSLKEQLTIRKKHKNIIWYYDFCKYIIKLWIQKMK